MPIKSVIFDLDGTITSPYLDFELIGKEMGLASRTLSILEAMQKMPEFQRKNAEKILEHHEYLAAEKSTLNNGARQTLLTLKNLAIPVGILTRNKRSNVITVQRKHRLHFDAIFAREDGPVKPDAFGVLHLCNYFGCLPAETIVVGDFIHDLLSAKNAGAIAVLIKTHKDADTFCKYADYSITKLDNLLKIIDDMNTQ